MCSTERAIALVRLDGLSVDQPSLEGGSQDGGRGPERGELVAAPITDRDAIVEPDRAPPFAADEHRELRQGDDAVQLEWRSFRLREVGDRAQHRLTPRQDLGPPAETRLFPRCRPEVDVVHDPDDAGGGPFGQPGRREPSFLVDDVPGDVGPRDAGGPTQPGQDLVGRFEPIGREEQALGGEGDGLDDAITVQRARGMCAHGVHLDRPLLSPTVDEPR